MSRVLLRDGLAVHYDVVGDGDVGALFAHGLTGTGAADWRLLLPDLTPHFRCVVPDLRGHGRSEFREGAVTAEAMADDMRALLDHEQMGRPHLLGFSMGAELALSLELADPGTARSLVLIGPSTGCPPDRGGYGPITSEPPHWPQLLRRLHDEHHGPEHWRRLFRAIAFTWGDRPEVAAEVLQTLQCPILIVHGQDEEPYKQRQAKILAESARDARLEVLSGAAHPVHVQRADAVNALVRDFLLDVDAVAGAPR